MSFHNPNHISNYSLSQEDLPQLQHSSCMMLPPLRAAPTRQPTAGLTLSNCSELSVSSHEDFGHNLIAPRYQVRQRFQQPNISSIVPPMSSRHDLSTIRSTISKSTKKIARARTKLPPTTSLTVASRISTAKKVRSSKSNIPGESRYWTPSEHKLFVEALLKYGPKDLKAISAYVGTRNMIQCRTHEQKCFMRLMREAQRETFQRDSNQFELDFDERRKLQKDVYSVPSSCGITLLCVVSEEMARSLQA